MPGRMHDGPELKEGGGEIPAFKFQHFTFHSYLKCTCISLYENMCICICTAGRTVGEAFEQKEPKRKVKYKLDF